MQGTRHFPLAVGQSWRFAILLVLPLLPACASDSAMLRTNGGCPVGAEQPSAKPKYLDQALAYLTLKSGEIGLLEPAKQLTFLCENVDEIKQKHVRFQQSHEGIPVWGQQLIVHLDAQDQASSTSGSVAPVAANIVTKPTLDKTIASATAAKAAGEGWKAQDSMLYFYPSEGTTRLAHLVNVKKGLQRSMVFVDAQTGIVLNQISASPSAK
jgi:Zn-dependent metalloprotease